MTKLELPGLELSNPKISPEMSRDEPADLPSWLSYIERLHPSAIEMGLDRIQLIIQKLDLTPKFKIITVAGTNGKGSTCAMLSQAYQCAGYLVGCYTSPHLLRYNERVRVNGAEASDSALCEAFSVINQARTGSHGADVPLTYFEVGTLAAIWHFNQLNIDIAILEVGLGGRLDAVNAFNPDCAIVTNVDLDHQDFLGDTRESIGFEKAGVYRADTPAICGDSHPPSTLIAHAQSIGAQLQCIHHAFDFKSHGETWEFWVDDKLIYTLPLPALSGDYQLNNAACAVAAMHALQWRLPVKTEAIAEAMRQVSLPGRFYVSEYDADLILDVAHNPHAAMALAANLNALRLAWSSSRQNVEPAPKVLAVFSMLADKDIKGVIEAVKIEIDVWYIAAIDHARGIAVERLASALAEAAPTAEVKVFSSVEAAYLQATHDKETCMHRNENDKIVAFGSFFTVASVMQYLFNHQTTLIRKQ